MNHQPKQKDLSMKHLVGLDLHSDNVCGIIADPNDRWVLKRKFPTCLKTILSAMEPYKEKIGGVVVEATSHLVLVSRRLNGIRVHCSPG